MNAPNDVGLIQFYLAELQDSGYLETSPTTLARPFNHDCGLKSDETSVLKAFQMKVQITDSEEISLGIVKHDGPTLRALVDYGDYAGRLYLLKQRTGIDLVHSTTLRF